MFFVDLWLSPRDLATRMSEMRIWLDGHKVEASGFLVNGAIIRLAFSASQHAEAFAARFAGRVIPDTPIRHGAPRPDRDQTGAVRDGEQRQLR